MRTLTEQAAAHHRLAAFITENDLPDASVSVSRPGRSVTVGASHCDLPENVVRRWAQALELVVDELPWECNGAAATMFTAGGHRDGVYWHVSAIVPIAVPA